MKNTLCCLFVFLMGTGICFAQYNSVSCYVVAHPDDWQLFMGVNAFNDIAKGATGSGKKVVLIYTTGGDGNCGGDTVSSKFIEARQIGANRSVQFCADIYSKHTTTTRSVVRVHGISDHNILRFSYKNVVSYFLHLPDGCFESKKASISKLAAGSISSLSTTDSTTTYHGYEDLVQTIGRIIRDESMDADEITINCPEWNEALSPKDHPDHYESGKIATRIAAKIPCVNLNLFEGYNTSAKPANLSPEDLAKEAALLGQLSFYIAHSGQKTEWDIYLHNGHVTWTYRNYFRTLITCEPGTVKDDSWKTKFYADSVPALDKYFVKLFPNPAKNVLNVTYEIMTDGWVTIVLYDIYGRQRGLLVNEQKEKGVFTVSYETRELDRGIYTIYAKTPQNVKVMPFTKD